MSSSGTASSGSSPRAQKKPTRRSLLEHSVTSAYCLTSPLAPPACSLPSLPANSIRLGSSNNSAMERRPDKVHRTMCPMASGSDRHQFLVSAKRNQGRHCDVAPAGTPPASNGCRRGAHRKLPLPCDCLQTVTGGRIPVSVRGGSFDRSAERPLRRGFQTARKYRRYRP